MKPTASYKMSTQAKRFLANIDDPHVRGAVKKTMIDAELTAALQPRRDRTAKTFNEPLTD
jgi:hypothetical protein